MARNGNPVRADRAAPAARALTRIGSPLQERAPPEARRVDVAQHRRVHDPDDGLAVGHQRDRHADHREAVHEVGGAVERIDEPADLGALAAGLLAEERELGGGVVQHRLHRGLAGGVGVADPVARPLLADVRARAPKRVEHDPGTGPGGTSGGAEEAVEVEVRRRAHGATASRSAPSSSGVPAATSCRRASASATSRTSPVGVDDGGACLAAHEQAAEVVPRARWSRTPSR